MTSQPDVIECQRCGWCCQYLNIRICYSDILRWSAEGRLDLLRAVSYIEDTDPSRTGFYFTRTVKAPRSPCQFYVDGECSIYDTRPRACAEFPQTQTAHQRTMLECPSIPDEQLELQREQKLDLAVAQAERNKLLRILSAAREIEKLTLEILKFGADPTESLYVSAFDSTNVAWTEVGSSPYLSTQNQPTDYIWTASKKVTEGNWDFANTARPSTDILNSVTLYVYGRNGAAVNSDQFYLYNGASWTDITMGAFASAWGWISRDVSSTINTWTKVDGCRMYIYHGNNTNQTDVDAAYLLVNYTAVVRGVAALSGTGSLTAIGTVVVPPVEGVAVLSGTGALSAIGEVTAYGIAALTGTGSLTAIGASMVEGVAALSGIGSLSAVGNVFISGVAALSGTGNLTATGKVITFGIGALSGTGNLVVVGKVIVFGAATLSGTGNLTAIGSVSGIVQGAATLTGTGSLVGAGFATQSGVAVLSGTGTLVAIGQVAGIVDGKAALSGAGDLSGVSSVTQNAVGLLVGTGTLSAVGLVYIPGIVVLSGVGNLTGQALVLITAVAALSGIGSLVASGGVVGGMERELFKGMYRGMYRG